MTKRLRLPKLMLQLQLLEVAEMLPKLTVIKSQTSIFNLPIQGVPFEKSQKEMAVAQKRYVFDPMLVKPKLV